MITVNKRRMFTTDRGTLFFNNLQMKELYNQKYLLVITHVNHKDTKYGR